MMHRKTQLAATVGAALLAVGTAAYGQTPALQVQLYGQFSRALMHADNETQSKWFFTDAQPSSTRFGIQGISQVTPGLRAGGRLEAEMKSNPSNEVTFATPVVTNTFAERWLDAWIEGGWGRLELGQGSGAADDASTIDLSGTGMANGSTLADWGGKIPFTNSAGASLGVGPDDVVNNMDFESRLDRIRYITPVFGGFKAQVGVGQKTNDGESTEASLWYAGKLAGDFQAAIGWSNVNLSTAAGGKDRETMGGSVGWLHTSGFNVAVNYTKRDLPAGRDATYWFTKVGYKFGQHAVSLAYSKGEDQAAAGDEATGMGVGYVWNPVRWAEFFASYILFELDRPGVSVNDITVAALGTRLRF